MPNAVAFRYARVLVDVVTDTSATTPRPDPRTITAQLGQFQELLQQNEELRIVCSTPAIAYPKKRAVLEKLASLIKLSSVSRNFLNVVLEHQRMPLLGEMMEAYESLLNEQMGLVTVEVTSARPLKEAEKRSLSEALRARTRQQVKVSYGLDPNLIGGVVARVGSTIYDGSVRGQLTRLRAELGSRDPGRLS